MKKGEDYRTGNYHCTENKAPLARVGDVQIIRNPVAQKDIYREQSKTDEEKDDRLPICLQCCAAMRALIAPPIRAVSPSEKGSRSLVTCPAIHKGCKFFPEYIIGWKATGNEA